MNQTTAIKKKSVPGIFSYIKEKKTADTIKIIIIIRDCLKEGNRHFVIPRLLLNPKAIKFKNRLFYLEAHVSFLQSRVCQEAQTYSFYTLQPLPDRKDSHQANTRLQRMLFRRNK